MPAALLTVHLPLCRQVVLRLAQGTWQASQQAMAMLRKGAMPCAGLRLVPSHLRSHLTLLLQYPPLTTPCNSQQPRRAAAPGRLAHEPTYGLSLCAVLQALTLPHGRAGMAARALACSPGAVTAHACAARSAVLPPCPPLL